MRQLRIIEYVQRQRTAKTSNMESFATIVKSNGFIEKYPTTPVGRFKRCWGQKIAPVLILMTLWKKSLVQSFVVLWSVLMKLWSYKVLNPAWMTSYQRIYKTFYSSFSLHIFDNFMKKESFTQFTVFWSFWPFLMNSWSCKVLDD